MRASPIVLLAYFGLLFSGLLPAVCPKRADVTPSSGLLLRETKAGSAPEMTIKSMEEEILGYVNADRSGLGLPPLVLNETESALAARHSENMARGKVGFGHGGFNGRAKAIQKAMSTVTSVAENVAEGPMTAREVVDGWLHSPGHKKNIEGNYTLTGIGYARDNKGNIYFTQLFSR